MRAFFLSLIAVCACSLSFRLHVVFAQTAEPTMMPAPEITILRQKVALQQLTDSENETPVVFEFSETEQKALENLTDIQNATYLADLYVQMRPKAAARLIMQLTNEQAVQIMQHMTTEQSAAILGHMDANRASTLSIHLANARVDFGKK